MTPTLEPASTCRIMPPPTMQPMMEFGESWAQVQRSVRLGDRLRRAEDCRIRTYEFNLIFLIACGAFLSIDTLNFTYAAYPQLS